MNILYEVENFQTLIKCHLLLLIFQTHKGQIGIEVGEQENAVWRTALFEESSKLGH